MAAAQYFDQVQKIYIAFYQRPADAAGLKYWAGEVDKAGGSLTAVINAFAGEKEAQDLYGTINATTIGTVIDKLYLALFGRAADTAGKDFYIDAFTKGTFSAGAIALAVLEGAQSADLPRITNKLAVANEFTAQVDGRALTDANFGTAPFNVTYSGEPDAIAARAILNGVTDAASTVLTPAQVTTALKDQIADATDPIKANNLTLTTAADTLTGGTGVDNFTGVVSSLSSEATLQVTDSLDGAEGNDTLTLNAKGDFTGFTTGSVKNVETITIGNTGTIDRTISTKGITGATTYNLNATGAAVNLSDLAAAGITVNLAGQAKGSTTLGFTADAVKGTADVLGLGLNALGTAEVKDAAGVVTTAEAAVTITAAGVETVNAVVTGHNVVNLAAADAKALNLSGAGSVKLTAVPAALKTLDASAVQGAVTVDLVAATGATSVKTGVGADKVTVTVGDDVLANATIDLGQGADTLVLKGTGVVQYALSNTETVSLSGLTGALTYSGTNTTGLTTIQSAKDQGAQTATFANMGATAINVQLQGVSTGTAVSSDHSGATAITVDTPASTATAIAPDLNNVNVSLSKSTSATLNVADKMNYTGVVTATKATGVTVAINGQTTATAEVSAAEATSVVVSAVANDSVLKLTTAAAKELNITATKSLALTGSTLTAVESVTVASAATTTVTALSKAANINLSGAGSVGLGTVGSATLDYGVTLTATGLASNKAGVGSNKSLDVGTINTKGQAITVNASGVMGAVELGAISALNGAAAAGNVSVNLNGTGGAIALGAITGKNVTVDATGALGAVTYGAINTESGGVVSVKGATLTASTVTVNTGAASTADNTISFTGGIDTDTFTVVATALFDKKIASLSATGGVQATGQVDTLVLNATAADLTVTSLTLDGIEAITVTTTATVNAAGVSGKTLAVNTGILTLTGTAAADTIDLSNITGTGSIVLNASAGTDTIKLGALVETIKFDNTAATNGADTITGFTTTSDKLSFKALTANYNLGDTNTTVLSVDTAGGTGATTSELVINTTKFANFAAITTAALDTQSGAVTAGKGVLLVVGDATNTYVYADTNGSTAGGQVLIATLVGVDVDTGIAAADFAFTI